MYDFNYHKPDSIEAAAKLFNDADDASYIAGGHTLLPSMKQRLAAPSDLIDLSGISELSQMTVSDDKVVIGAMCTHDDVATSPELQRVIPALAGLAGGIGDAQVRNRGTMGGSVSNSDPAADYPAAVLGLGGDIHTSQRTISADDFFKGMFETALDEGEILTGVSYPVPEAASYIKFPNPASRYATVGVWITRHQSQVRVAITGAAPSVFRATAMEEALATNFDASALDGVSIDPDGLNSDLHASAEYRANLCVVMAKRAVSALTG